MTIQLKSTLYTFAIILCGVFFTAADGNAKIVDRAVPGWLKCCECTLREYNNQLIRENKSNSMKSCIISSIMEDMHWKKCTDQTNQETCYNVNWHATSILCEPFNRIPRPHNCSEHCQYRDGVDCSKDPNFPRKEDCTYYEDGYTGKTYDEEYVRPKPSEVFAKHSISKITERCKQKDNELPNLNSRRTQLIQSCDSGQLKLGSCIDSLALLAGDVDREIYLIGVFSTPELSQSYESLRKTISSDLSRYRAVISFLYDGIKQRFDTIYNKFDANKVYTIEELEAIKLEVEKLRSSYSDIRDYVESDTFYYLNMGLFNVLVSDKLKKLKGK